MCDSWTPAVTLDASEAASPKLPQKCSRLILFHRVQAAECNADAWLPAGTGTSYGRRHKKVATCWLITAEGRFCFEIIESLLSEEKSHATSMPTIIPDKMQ